MKDITQQLYDLNEEFYKLFWRLFENDKSLITNDNKAVFAASIIGIYKIEAKKLLLSYEGEQNQEIYRLECLKEEKTPKKRKFLFWRRNRANKIIDKLIDEQLEKYFKELEKSKDLSGQGDKSSTSEESGQGEPARGQGDKSGPSETSGQGVPAGGQGDKSGPSEASGQGAPARDQGDKPGPSEESGQGEPAGGQGDKPGTSEESGQSEPPNKRHHHKKKETPSETLPAETEQKFDEVQTAMGAQIRLPIP